MKNYYFTSESVTEGHPDKLCDYISDSILDECLKQDKNSRVAIETFVSANTVTIAGQITSTARLKIGELVREKIKEIGFDNENTDIDYRTCKIQAEITTIPKLREMITKQLPQTAIRQTEMKNKIKTNRKIAMIFLLLV